MTEITIVVENAITIPCPVCNAKSGELCTTTDGSHYHLVRVLSAKPM